MQRDAADDEPHAIVSANSKSINAEARIIDVAGDHICDKIPVPLVVRRFAPTGPEIQVGQRYARR